MKKRIEELDVCKGLGMILVILGHMLLLGDIKTWVLSFYMPMFVVVSGVLFKPKPLKNHFMSIMAPYYLLGLLCILIYDGIVQRALLKNDLISLAMGCNATQYIVYAAAPLWFLSMLFVLRCVYEILNKYIKQMWLLTLAVLALCAVGCCMAYRRAAFAGVYNIDIALVMLPFFHVGRLAGKNMISGISGWKWWQLSGMTAALGAASYYMAGVNGGYDLFIVGIGGNPVLFYITALLGTGFMLSLSSMLSKAICVKQALTAIGKRTLYLLPVHYPMTLIVNSLNERYSPGTVYSILEFAIVLCVSLAVSRLIECAVDIINTRLRSAPSAN